MDIVVGETRFRLPRVSEDKFRELAGVMEYYDGFWRVPNSSWKSAYEVMSKYFKGFYFYVRCSYCNKLIGGEYYDLHVGMCKREHTKVARHLCPSCGEEMEMTPNGEPFKCKCGYEGFEFRESDIDVL